MNRLLQILLGIKPAPWAAGSRWSLEWLALPKHDRLLMLIVAIAFATWGVLWLYRREGRSLSLPIRWSLATLRMVLLLGILASRVLALIVYQATPRDPLVLAGVVLAMALLGLVATWIPAQRALAIDPVILLREE